MPDARARLERLSRLVQCVACGAPCRPSTAAQGLTCTTCGASYGMRDGVLAVDAPVVRAEVLAEREGVVATERDPSLGGINDAFDDLSRATGPLRNAILALPEGDGSRYYQEPGYFRNVRASRRGFRFVLERLPVQPGQRLLDIGADLTWSTNEFARRGLECVALDVNHHLAVGELFQSHYGAPYDMVRADMHVPLFCDASFDVVVAFNALHHTGNIDELACNLARVLKRGGHLGAVEPYCVDPAQKAGFGGEQIAAGINENTYMLDEWHRAFSAAGLVLEEVMLTDSCNMIYSKPAGPGPSQQTMLERAHRGGIIAHAPVRWEPGRAIQIRVAINNRSNATWCSEGRAPIFASYHLARRHGAASTMVAFDNRRTAIPDIAPGRTVNTHVTVDVPAEPGAYDIIIDLVQEGICWFAERGFEPATMHVDRQPSAWRTFTGKCRTVARRWRQAVF